MKVKLRYTWCGPFIPCLSGRTAYTRPPGVEALLNKLTGLHWGERGERVYSDPHVAARHAALLILLGYNVWLEPLEPPRSKTGDVDELRYIPVLDRMARRIASQPDPEAALNAAAEAISELILLGLERGERLEPLYTAVYKPLTEVFTLYATLHDDNAAVEKLKEEKPWTRAAYTVFAPWRLLPSTLSEMARRAAKEAGRAVLGKIRGLVTRRA